MRSSLLGSLVQVLRTNLTRRADRVRVCEIGRVFLRDASIGDGDRSVAGVRQPLRVAGLLHGGVDGRQWGRKDAGVDFFDAKGDVQALLAPRRATFCAGDHPAMHPGRCAEVLVDGHLIGHVGELHPRWRLGYELPHAPMLFELDLESVLSRPVPTFTAVPRQQPVLRDLALVVSEGVEHDALMSALRADPAGLVRTATLFDVYKPAAGAAGFSPGERSLAVRLELLDDSGTLTDDRIDAAADAAVQRAQQQCGARLRA